MTERRLVLRFPKLLLDQPVISTTVRRYDLNFNILRAQVSPAQEGLVVLGLEGSPEAIAAAVEWMTDQGVDVTPLDRTVVRDDEVCTHCGACVVVCPSGALFMDLESREVHFDAEKCVACGACVPACPPRAMSISF